MFLRSTQSPRHPPIKVVNEQGSLDLPKIHSELQKPENAGKYVYVNPNGQLAFSDKDDAQRGRRSAQADVLPAKLEAAARQLCASEPSLLPSALGLLQSQTGRNQHGQSYLLLTNNKALQDITQSLSAAEAKAAALAQAAPPALPPSPRRPGKQGLLKRQAAVRLPRKTAVPKHAAVSPSHFTGFDHPQFALTGDLLDVSLRLGTEEQRAKQLDKLMNQIAKWHPPLAEYGFVIDRPRALQWLLRETQFSRHISPTTALWLWDLAQPDAR